MIQDSLVVLPLRSELEFFTKALREFGWKSLALQAGAIPMVVFPEQNLRCAIGGHGKTQFGIHTQFLLQEFPDASRVFCVGAAGGLNGVQTFDLVIGEETIEHDYSEKFDPAPPPRFSGCAWSLEQLALRAARAKLDYQVHIGGIASGDEDIVDRERATQLHEKTQALAVAWEGAGGARAALFNRKPFLEIRAITDIADNSAPIDFRANLKKAMTNAAELFALEN